MSTVSFIATSNHRTCCSTRLSQKLWLADFGLARFQTDRPLTRTGEMIGTMRYMSPEQVAGRSELIDHRTDVYSLGATLYEAITHEPAVVGTEGPGLNAGDRTRFTDSSYVKLCPGCANRCPDTGRERRWPSIVMIAMYRRIYLRKIYGEPQAVIHSWPIDCREMVLAWRWLDRRRNSRGCSRCRWCNHGNDRIGRSVCMLINEQRNGCRSPIFATAALNSQRSLGSGRRSEQNEAMTLPVSMGAEAGTPTDY